MISENRRGRPSEFSDHELTIARSVSPEVKSTRQLHSVAYRQRAINALMHDKRFLWLVDEEECMRGTGNGWKPAILAELGRVGSDDQIREVAAVLCELKPATKEAIEIVREYRGYRRRGASDTSLSVVTEAWGRLPPEVKQAIVNYVRENDPNA